MKRKDKSLLLKKQIIDVSRKLFISQGYAATTMRQILGETGLTTGSLYHFFKNKEDILKQIAALYLVDTNRFIASILDDDDPIVHYALANSVSFKATDTHEHLAELWYTSYNLWGISEMIHLENAKRSKILFKKYNKDMSNADWFNLSVVVDGVHRNLLFEKLNRNKISFKERLQMSMRIAMFLYNLPPEKIEPSIVRAEKILKNNQFEFYGVTI